MPLASWAAAAAASEVKRRVAQAVRCRRRSLSAAIAAASSFSFNILRRNVDQVVEFVSRDRDRDESWDGIGC